VFYKAVSFKENMPAIPNLDQYREKAPSILTFESLACQDVMMESQVHRKLK
jgi:hypothetical protein